MHNPQFNTRALLFVIATCAISFALIGGRPHQYMLTAALMILLFWLGAALAFAGEAMNNHGDVWLIPGVVTSVIGALVAVIALFTMLFYSGLFVFAEFPKWVL